MSDDLVLTSREEFFDLRLSPQFTPAPPMPAFPYTEAPLQPHPGFIATSEGGKFGGAIRIPHAGSEPYIQNNEAE